MFSGDEMKCLIRITVQYTDSRSTRELNTSGTLKRLPPVICRRMNRSLTCYPHFVVLVVVFVVETHTLPGRLLVCASVSPSSEIIVVVVVVVVVFSISSVK
jgi:hypothetical protein